MRRFLLLLLLSALLCGSGAFGQVITLDSNQALPLIAAAGNDVSVVSGNSAILGDNPSATNGYGGYIYLWSPAEGLDDPTLANPTATPGITTTYTLTVTDSKNCTAQDEVMVTITANGIAVDPNSLVVRVFPNPSNGSVTLNLEGPGGALLIRIYNSTGTVVRELSYQTEPWFSQTIDTRSFPKGNYYILLNCNGKIVSKPLVIL